MLSKSEKKEITDKIAKKFESLPEEIDSEDYFDDPDNQKELNPPPGKIKLEHRWWRTKICS